MRVERRREREGVREREKERRKNGRECACERVWEGKSETERIKISQRLGNGHVGSRTFRTRRSDAFNYSRFEISIYRIFIKMLFFFFFKSTIFICCFVSLLPRWCYFSLPLSISLSLPPSLSISLSLFLFLLYSFPWNTSFFTTATKRESGTMIFLGGHDGESISSGILDVTASREEKKENRKESATERARRNTRLPPPVSGLYLCFILYYIYIYIIYINIYKT